MRRSPAARAGTVAGAAIAAVADARRRYRRGMAGTWTAANVRHALGAFRYGRTPAATVYDSLGDDFFLALAPGWLNLGLWEGDGTDPPEAPLAVRRLVTRLAEELPTGGDVLDVGNGLG